ncbi:RNA polymerase sigma-70 factor [Chryseosolibacter indicus]|uniref:RNA polymerase sigma-70 factor n=1 Tax=Chryseosolibacter indicus TaxID=2782351 RepID=A0ABS5VKM3_9BACT|nr:RNA polymerase sigma-70 factor [Chryseosolibacter indicus]
MELTEQDLLIALAEGDITAFEMYFKTLYQPLCNYAFTFLQDKEEAEEIVQSAFLSFWEKREGLNIRTSPKSYFYAMVRNACLNVIKHQKIKQKYIGEELALTNPGSEAVAEAISSDELERRIHEAISLLPEQCRLVFKLSRFEELKYQEIATQLNISIKTVENHMGKALKIMREQLKDYLPIILLLMNGLLN